VLNARQMIQDLRSAFTTPAVPIDFIAQTAALRVLLPGPGGWAEWMRRHLWWAWWAGCLGSLLVSVWSWRAGADAAREAIALREQLAALSAVAASAPASARLGGDFVQSLPALPPEPGAVVSQLQRACRAAGVTLLSVAVAQHAASPTDLGRLDLDVEMKGPYPGIKQVLVETLERHASSTVRTLRMRNDAAPNMLQANVVVSLWARPAMGAAPGASSTAGSR
jgi:hypothetical protein